MEGPVIAGLARTNVQDIDAAWNAVKDSERPRIHTFISTSDIHIEHQLQTTREDVKGQARAAVAHAKRLCDDVEFSPMDATRSELEFTAEVLEIALEEGATTINVPDTVGYSTPEEHAEMWRTLYRLVPGLAERDHLGALPRRPRPGRGQLVRRRVASGCRQVECAINGIGERAGNASLEEIVMLLHVREAAHGLWCEVDTTEIARTSRLVSRMTGYQVQPNKAIVGRNAFAHESGIHQDGVLKERTTYEIMDATTIGLEQNQIVLGKHSGRHALRNALQELGFTGRRRRAEHRVQGVQGAGGQEEGGHRARPGGDRLRRDPPVGRRLRARVVRGRGLLGAAPRWPASGSGCPTARSPRAASPGTARWTPSSAP